ncbi:MAG TPA: LysR family transcriptional regulator [Acidimicrobiia bacterium]|nr:LysR family transcriptional regulator [Acidimicrobiia bacterium]
MTLTQLECFVLVARLGSVTAAARALGVSEPAVSSALGALRTHLGDQLVIRGATGMELTAAGRRLVPIASQMIHLGAEAQATVRQAQGAAPELRVLASSTIAEYVAPSLVETFARKASSTDTTVGVATAVEMQAFLQDRLADVALGPKLAGDGSVQLNTQPVMRCSLQLLTSPRSRLAGVSGLSPSKLADVDWLVDPAGTDPSSPVSQLIGRLGVPDHRVKVLPSQTAALAAAADDDAGVAPAVAHLALAEIRRNSVVPVDVAGFPLSMFWHVSTLAIDRASTIAWAFRRFLTTAVATQIMLEPSRGVPPNRFKPPVYVTLWN